MTELEREYQEKTGKNAIGSYGFDLQEYHDWVKEQLIAERVRTGAMGAVIDGLSKEVDTLRSLTSWHTGVPEESGLYYGKFSVATSCSYKHICYYTKGDEEPWSHQWLDENGITELHDAPIAWAFLPKEGQV